MKLSFYGAARSVTGSRHLAEIPGCNVLMDCGMFQGRRQEAEHHNRRLGFDPKSVGAVLLSHAHIDHSGALPMLTKKERRRGKQRVQPFYDTDDARRIVRQFRSTRYEDTIKIAPRITASFHDAGHILGSAAVRLKYTHRGNTLTILFTGDLRSEIDVHFARSDTAATLRRIDYRVYLWRPAPRTER
jgi:metallo-beta-lactamase family protein